MDNLEEELMLVSPLNHFCFQRGSVRESACMGVGREEVKGGGRGGMKEGGRARHLARLSSLTTRCFYLSAERRCLSNQTEGSLTELSFSKHAGAGLEACRRGSRSMKARVYACNRHVLWRHVREMQGRPREKQDRRMSWGHQLTT
jgi:hypothetical protein